MPLSQTLTRALEPKQTSEKVFRIIGHPSGCDAMAIEYRRDIYQMREGLRKFENMTARRVLQRVTNAVSPELGGYLLAILTNSNQQMETGGSLVLLQTSFRLMHSQTPYTMGELPDISGACHIYSNRRALIHGVAHVVPCSFQRWSRRHSPSSTEDCSV